MGQADTHLPQRMHWGILHGLLLVGGEGQDGAGALGHGDVRGVLGHAHHGAAGDQLEGVLLHAAAGVQQGGDGGADGALQVLGLLDAGAGDGDDLAHHGHAGGQRPEDGAGGVDVEHGAADVGGQSAGGHLPAGDGLAELLLTALGVAAAQGLHHHGGLLGRDDLVHGVDAVLLVVLHADE